MASEIEVHDFGSIKGVLKSIRTLGETIRTGDIGGLPFITTAPTGDPGAAMIEVIRSPDEVLVVVINTNVKGYSNLLCHTEVTSRHWTFKTLTIDKLEVGSSSASGIELGSFGEVVGGQRIGAPPNVTLTRLPNGHVQLSNLLVDAKNSVRFFTFAVGSRNSSSNTATRTASSSGRMQGDARGKKSSSSVTARFDSAGGATMTVDVTQTTELPASPGLVPDRLLPKEAIQLQLTPDEQAAYTIHLPVGGGAASDGQAVLGFGGAFTDAVASVFDDLKPELQQKVLNLMWGPNGQRYNLARLTIGSTDFSTTVYNYNRNEDDYNQTKFSIAHDTEKIIPLINRAQQVAALASGITFLSSPWSPPGWMKRPYLSRKGQMRNSAKPGMVDKETIYDSYALYTSKYLTAYKAAGINVSMVTIQNEPDSADHMFPVAYPACNFDGKGEGKYLKKHLGPRLRADHPDVKIFVHDGQKYHDVPILNRVNDIIDAAGKDWEGLVDGVAFHWYGNNLKNYQFLQELHNTYPTLALLATEATLEAPSSQTLGTTPWKEAQKYAVDIIGDLNAGANGWIEWNVLLDKSGGPTCIGTTGGTDCTPLAGHCDAPILADTTAGKQSLEIRDTFFFMGHFSRFIPPGSVVLKGLDANVTNTDATFVSTAVRTPAGDVVVVALNVDQANSVTYQLAVPAAAGASTAATDRASADTAMYYAPVVIPPHSIQTLTVRKGTLDLIVDAHKVDL